MYFDNVACSKLSAANPAKRFAVPIPIEPYIRCSPNPCEVGLFSTIFEMIEFKKLITGVIKMYVIAEIEAMARNNGLENEGDPKEHGSVILPSD